MAGGDQLLLSPLQPFHQGRYTCLARGAGTEMRKDFMVLVRGRASSRWQGSLRALPRRGAFLPLLFLSLPLFLAQWHPGSPARGSPVSTACWRAEE